MLLGALKQAVSQFVDPQSGKTGHAQPGDAEDDPVLTE